MKVIGITKGKTFIALVQEKLKTGSLSLRGICRAAGIDASYLSKVLQGKRPPPADEKTLIRLAKVLGTDPHTLIISTGMIPSSLQRAMESPEFMKRIFPESERPRRSSPAVSPVRAARAVLPSRSPHLSEDLL